MAGKGARKEKSKSIEDVQKSQRLWLFGILGSIVIVFSGLVWADQAGVFSPPGGALCEGVTGAPASPIHDHAMVFVYIDDRLWDFSNQRYQVQDGTMHFENGARDAQGAQMHIHLDRGSERPSIACYFSTLTWSLTEDEIRTDTGEKYTSETGTITYKANGQEVGPDYKPKNDDRIEIRYTPNADAPPDGPAGGDGNNTTAPR